MVLNAAELSYTEGSATKDIIEKSGMSTVPIIYLNDTLIGGYNELCRHVYEQTLR